MALNNLEKRLKTFQKKFPAAKKAGIEPFAEKSANLRMISKIITGGSKILLIGSICTPHSRRRLIFHLFLYFRFPM